MPCNRQYGRGTQPGLVNHRCQPGSSNPRQIRTRNSSVRSWMRPNKSWSDTVLTSVPQLMRKVLPNCDCNCRRCKPH